MAMRRNRLGEADGFTLIEMLIGISILALLVGVIGGALVVGLRTTDETTSRMSESHDAQIASAYLANDVQSARVITSTTCPAGTPGSLINFSYDGGSQIASYYYAVAANGETQVTRRFCDAGGSQVSNDVLAHFSGGAPPTVTCDGGACAPGSQPTPDVVRIEFIEASGYNFTLLGSRRLYDSNVTAVSPGLTLLAFGTSPLQVKGGCKKNDIDPGPDQIEECAGETWDPHTQNDEAKLVVNGNLFVNSAVNGAVRITGKGNLSASGLFQILQGGTCVHCKPNNTSPYPPGSYFPSYDDPLRFMAAPTGTTSPGCSGGVCQPGVYNSTLNLGSGPTTLNPGIYILKSGMSVNAQAVVNGNGVLIYNESGALTFNGGSQLNLTPYASDPYKGVLIFQGRSNSSDVRLSGGTNLNPASLVGIIYAPNANNVYLGSGGAFMHVTAVVAQNIVVTGNSSVTIG